MFYACEVIYRFLACKPVSYWLCTYKRGQRKNYSKKSSPEIGRYKSKIFSVTENLLCDQQTQDQKTLNEKYEK